MRPSQHREKGRRMELTDIERGQQISEALRAAIRRRSPEAEAERRRKISLAMRGKNRQPRTPEWKAKIAAGNRAAWERRRAATEGDSTWARRDTPCVVRRVQEPAPRGLADA